MSEGNRPAFVSRVPPWVWLAAGLLFVSIRLLVPRYIDNEMVYALGPIKILHPGFLPTHPFLERFYPFFWVFDVAASPFYYALDWLAATLILRVIIWTFQLWSLARLGRTLGLEPWTILLTLVLWLSVEQTLVAGEWIIGCTSAKPVAYGFVFLALDAALRERPGPAGVFAGLATCFHVLVGGWTMAALGAAVVAAAGPGTRVRTALRYGVPAGAVALIGLAPALYEIATSAATDSVASIENTRLYVEWMNPYHVDPTYFMVPLEYGKLAFYGVLTLGLTAGLTHGVHRRVLVGFLAVLALFFTGGLLARALEWWSVLKYYPFRVADAVYPLAFWTCVAGAIQASVRRLGRPAWILVALSLPIASLARWANDRLDRGETQSLFTVLLQSEPRMSAYWTRETGREWLRFLRSEPEDDLAPMLSWIRRETSPDAVFIIPPWQADFTMRARRSEFISSKMFAVERMLEYRARMEAVNGGPIRGRGRAIFRELRRNYPNLTPAAVRAAAARYRADYLLTPTDYRLDFPLVHQAEGWRLYAIREGT